LDPHRPLRHPDDLGRAEFTRSRGRPLRTLLAGLLAAGLAACDGANIEKYPQTIFAPASDYAHTVDGLTRLITYLGIAVGIIVFVLLVFVLVRFRYRPDAPEPEQVHGNTRLELAWTLIPALLLAFIAARTVPVIFETQQPAPEHALRVDVRGWQWWWEFRYPIGNDTVVTANEIHVPVGTPIDLRMTSGDVIHSFWVPQMGGKRDVIPGRFNHIVFTPTKPGVYYGQCAEFCGDSHALMMMRLIAHTPEDFERWLANERKPAVEPAPTDSAVLLGKKLVTQGACAGCHIIEGTNATVGRSGPNLTHLARRGTIAAGWLPNNAESLTRWIHDPQAVKPGAKMPNLGLSEQDLAYVVAYLQTLY
jgi:cytochrome c oxidase subunit 2